MRSAFLRVFGLGAVLALGVRVAAQDSRTPTANPRTPTGTPTYAGTPNQTPEAPPPDAGLMKPSPTPRTIPAAAPHPLSAADCADGAWQRHAAPKFANKGACDAWVKEYIAPDEVREFDFPHHDRNGAGASLRRAAALLI